MVEIRAISPQDNPRVAHIIRTVMPEFGASGEGFAIHDPEVDTMYENFQQPRSAYFVVEWNGEVVAGGGVAPLKGDDPKVCELQKMYMLPEARGKGIGNQLLNHCLDTAQKLGYTQCYLETFETMHQAMHLYRKNGFQPIAGAMGCTGHFACNKFFLKNLNPLS
jgi:putative acetyltransferase